MSRCCRLSTVMLAVLTGCSDTSPEPERACADDISVGEVQRFGDPPPSRTEGITFGEDGLLYVSALNMDADDQLLRYSFDGSFESVAESPSILGLAPNRESILAAAIETGELLRIGPDDGAVEVLATDLGAPNFIVNTPWGTLLVSDDTDGEDEIDEVTLEGEVSTWVSGIPTPNGMVFSLDGSVLYVATTFTEPGVWRIPVSAGGVAGTPEIWVSFGATTTPDGITIDSEGNLYVALNLAERIAKIDRDGNVSEDFAEVDTPASLAFGQGSFDPCSIYVTSLFSEQVFRVGTGVLGVEDPPTEP